MTRAQLEKFIVYLQKQGWLVLGPVLAKEEFSMPSVQEELSPYLKAHLASRALKTPAGVLQIRAINRASELILDSRLPLYPLKQFFVPEKETLFEWCGSFSKEKGAARKIVLLGVNVLDLKAVNLYDQVFEKDSYYQARRRNLLIVGHANVPEIEDNIFEYKYEEDILEHLPFDIFLANAAVSCKIFTGSIKGQRILEHFGYKNYEHIQFSGPVKEGKLDERMIKLRDKLKNHHNQKLWEELGRRCIECGKCTLACPTCFCFRIDDQAGLKDHSGTRQRCWDSCYYQEFSEISGGHKFLSSTAARIHFWYYHKFARIPDEFDFMGCVGCRRCTKVCPVGIDIAEVIKEIQQ